ncbi:chorismate-binding protein [Lactococcus carnosus]|uniref:chorismate-binding protein n=1 Tax=Pseudolactococcus carnosus TaxID=2749961 RepID=UPI000812BE6E|nr:chorismate-binding protein [Lactococcus carnosus]SCA91561.1 Putative para-aminobenzoate synthase (Aminodeoxychorismate synthase) PabB [Lactococcus piscium]MCJ1969764.1 chloride transporter [Lactococcus carnosus]MCJ1973785.1 chloride transporter [Lactococcus carnosus]MCJ1976238.1 chloride transporter [Lactococcus carnosus]MCJ1980623.1 chloride transporter [Lactococcus carnosus]
MIIYDDKKFDKALTTLIAFDKASFIAALDELEKWQKTHYAVGYIRYEAKAIFLGEDITSKLPLLYFEIFDSYTPYTPSAVPSLTLVPQAQLTFDGYADAITKIKQAQRQGDTYEVNYTYDYKVPYDGDDFKLYEHLLTKQRTPYNTFIKNDYDTLLSFSPELFFEVKQEHITTRPMKGTVKRGKTAAEDAVLIDFLKTDEKNRAENVMIVDLMRNDLGRIAKNGTVAVSKLFDVETHATVHQMTSQIEADLEEGTSVYTILEALFPNGSITGAPKESTMRLIDKIEQGSRDIYCGAIGFLSPEQQIFSVPIRILQRQAGASSFTYRVGGAIIWDSDTTDEWLETQAKTSFLQDEVKLIETLKVENGKLAFKAEHLARLSHSASIYGFKLHEDIAKIQPEQDGMMRIALSRDGHYDISYREQIPFDKVAISPMIVDSSQNFLYHKTTQRPYYTTKDELFFNERGELTEMSRANVILEIAGHWFTPPVSSGLLAGIYRQHLLDTNQCQEHLLYKSDLLKADKIFCCNSVQGIKEVFLI